ncbi:hypothetical protein D3C75_1221260 [compost metagenome]
MDDYVHPSEGFLRPGEGCRHRFRLCHIGLHCHSITACGFYFGYGGVRLRMVAGVNNHYRLPLLGESYGCLSADAPGASGHYSDSGWSGLAHDSFLL